MAIPPDPIDEVINDASDAVLAEVSRIVAQDPQKPEPMTEPGMTDLPTQAARQVVELKVKEVLFGGLARPGATFEAVKPAGAYALREGNSGPFLIKAAAPGGTAEILGRYGPDTYPAELIKAAMKRHGKG
jgi:hypothetical protein